jgi:membrane-bound ClpP family serine protease
MYFGTNYKEYSAEREIALSFMNSVVKALFQYFIGCVVWHLYVVLTSHYRGQNVVGIIALVLGLFKHNGHARL